MALATAGCSRFPASSAASTSPGEAVVAEVIDGDTIEVIVAGQREPVRLIGIDTPETVDPRRPVECFGREASDHMSTLLPEGTPVRLERDIEARDDYGRLLAYVFRPSDTLFVNLALVEDGYANLLTIPPNVTYAEEFADAAGRAREAGRGLWSSCPP